MDIKEILIKNNFRFKKSLGQNFITDTNLLEAIERRQVFQKKMWF